MIELEEADLAKALSQLSKLCERLAGDIAVELDSPERTNEIAQVLEDTVYLLRARADEQAPKVVDQAGDPPVEEVWAQRFSSSGPAGPVGHRGVNWRSRPAHHQEVTDVGDSGGR